MQLMSEWSGHWRKGRQLSSPPLSPGPLQNVSFSYLTTPLLLSSPFFFLMQNFFELQEKLVLLLL